MNHVTRGKHSPKRKLWSNIAPYTSLPLYQARVGGTRGKRQTARLGEPELHNNRPGEISVVYPWHTARGRLAGRDVRVGNPATRPPYPLNAYTLRTQHLSCFKILFLTNDLPHPELWLTARIKRSYPPSLPGSSSRDQLEDADSCKQYWQCTTRRPIVSQDFDSLRPMTDKITVSPTLRMSTHDYLPMIPTKTVHFYVFLP